MTKLSEGTQRFILIDTAAAVRNTSRRLGRCEPTALVVEPVETGGVRVYAANVVSINGEARAEHSQERPLFKLNGVPYFAALSTTAEVVIGEEGAPERASQTPDVPAAPTTTQARPQKPKRAAVVTTEEQ